jgi:hypothetical protein
VPQHRLPDHGNGTGLQPRPWAISAHVMVRSQGNMPLRRAFPVHKGTVPARLKFDLPFLHGILQPVWDGDVPKFMAVQIIGPPIGHHTCPCQRGRKHRLHIGLMMFQHHFSEAANIRSNIWRIQRFRLAPNFFEYASNTRMFQRVRLHPHSQISFSTSVVSKTVFRNSDCSNCDLEVVFAYVITHYQHGRNYADFLVKMNLSMTSISISVRLKQANACSGASTTGSFSLKLVLSTIP